MLKIQQFGTKILLIAGSVLAMAFTSDIGSVKYKCLVQMINYTGEDAYVAISLMNPEGEYERTLYVQGDDNEWYSDIKNWWAFSQGKNEKLDGITGASIGNGERQVLAFEIDETKIDAGYKIRFESAVENQDYHVTDAELSLNAESVNSKIEGKGYIRYVRIIPN